MDLEFLKRIGRTTAALGALVFVFAAVYYRVDFALGVLVGCLWGVANFAALAGVLTATIRPGGVDRRRALILATVKFPALYGVGYLILHSGWFGPIPLLAGFSLLFFVTLLKALGRLYLKLDERTSTSPAKAVSR
ncbi:MAG: hypothetical protein AB1792_04365 [Candidatus Zixiibacteriota bacterium]